MDYLDLILTFHQKYSKRWYVINDVLFLRYLIASLISVLVIVLYLANHNFDQDNLFQLFDERYIKYIVNSYDSENPNYSRLELYDYDASVKNSYKAESAENSDVNVGTSRRSASTTYKGLLGEDFEVLTHEIDNLAPPTRFNRKSNKRRSGSVGTDGNLYLEDYKIYRNAGLYLNIPEYLLEEKANYVHRDQDEILRVIYSKSSFIESCYQQAARKNIVKRGFVKVEFLIAANGYVLPASIKILDSTIRNKEVEQCIKKNIRRWKTFEKLDNNPGIAHVVHKFVFN
jgi:hypothetical protein